MRLALLVLWVVGVARGLPSLNVDDPALFHELVGRFSWPSFQITIEVNAAVSVDDKQAAVRALKIATVNKNNDTIGSFTADNLSLRKVFSFGNESASVDKPSDSLEWNTARTAYIMHQPEHVLDHSPCDLLRSLAESAVEVQSELRVIQQCERHWYESVVTVTGNSSGQLFEGFILLKENANHHTKNNSTAAKLQYSDCFKQSLLELDAPTSTAIVVLGNTGSGKTTFTQFIAGNSRKLWSREVEPGTEEYIIVDNDKIGSALKSKTMVTELVVDPTTNASFWDCPGFEDNRGTCIEVASAYFVKNIMSKASAVKLILAVNYPSVQVGMDRNDFLSLLKHTTKIMKNVGKFTPSVALVVTKTPNSYSKHKQLQSDLVIKKKIAYFLKLAKEELLNWRENANALDSISFHNDAVQILDAFLEWDGMDYPRIGLFRRPDAEGPVDDIELMQSGKVALRKMVYNSTEFREVGAGEFGFTLSPAARLDVQLFADQINNDIGASVGTIATNMIGSNGNTSADLDDLDKSKNEIYGRIANLEPLILELERVNNSKQFVKHLMTKCSALHITIPDSTADLLQRAMSALEYFQVVSEDNLGVSPSEWVTQLKDGIKTLTQINVWNGFLTELFTELSNYNVQMDRQKFIARAGVIQNNTRSKSDLIDVLEKGELQKLLPFITGIEMDSEKITFLEKVFSLTLFEPFLNSYCEHGNTLVVEGAYIKLSEALNAYKCSSFSSIYIFAWHTVFIDTDLHRAGKDTSVFIVAPRWYIVGSREIDLDGTRGYSGYSTTPPKGQLAGSPGEPGGPGGPGGEFYGIGSEFVNGQGLHVHANGGDGGHGGDGTPGVSGSDGSDGRASFRGLEIGIFADKRGSDAGSPGQMGGAGGDGGAGGYGGAAGTVHVRNLGVSPSVKTSARTGNTGAGGKGARGGRGGAHGKRHVKKKQRVFFIPVSDENYYTPGGPPAADGPDGSDGAATAGQVYPRSSVKRVQDYTLIFKFKRLVREQILLHRVITRGKLEDFLNRL